MQNSSGTSAAGLDARRRKALYHAWHRGTREMDLLLGRYAEAALATMSDDDLTVFEELMETADQELMPWMLGTKPVPEAFRTPVYEAIVAYARANPLV